MYLGIYEKYVFVLHITVLRVKDYLQYISFNVFSFLQKQGDMFSSYNFLLTRFYQPVIEPNVSKRPPQVSSTNVSGDGPRP